MEDLNAALEDNISEETEEISEALEGAEEHYLPTLEEDIEELRMRYPELSSGSADELFKTERFAELRALGLSAEEAYLATARQRRSDGRAHLSSSLAAGVGAPRSAMPERELRAARELFSDMSDAEIRRLYKKVRV